MVILVSACLLGVNCRYDGMGQVAPGIERILAKHTVIPICPEQLGGLMTPRVVAECVGNRVITRDGRDVTEQFHKGAEEVLKLARLFGAEVAILKERSPSCGRGKIYDGSFQGTLTEGNGVTVQLLLDHGIKVYGESELGVL